MSDLENLENKPSPSVAEKNKKGKTLLIAISAVTICLVAGVFFYFSYEKNNYVKTNNASVQYNMITIAPKIAGEILDIKVKQGDYIQQGEVIMELAPAIADSSQIDNSYIRSAISGVVLRIIGVPGQTVALGQTVAYIANDSNAFIVSNIDEKDINKIKIGQNVDVTLDQFGRQKFYGKVVEVGSATLSAFSIVPSASSGTFIKTTQYVPVKIQFIEQYENLLVGANASVSIRLK